MNLLKKGRKLANRYNALGKIKEWHQASLDAPADPRDWDWSDPHEPHEPEVEDDQDEEGEEVDDSE